MEIVSRDMPVWKRRQKTLKGFNFPNFVGCFQVNIVAAKGLRPGAPVLTAGGLNTQTLHERSGLIMHGYCWRNKLCSFLSVRLFSFFPCRWWCTRTVNHGALHLKMCSRASTTLPSLSTKLLRYVNEILARRLCFRRKVHMRMGSNAAASSMSSLSCDVKALDMEL